MVISTSAYPGEAYWFKASLLTNTQVHTAIADIRRWYEAGMPFYTKENIRKLAQQLELAQKSQRSDGRTICIRALDGTVVDFKIESGEVLSLDKSGVERILYVVATAAWTKTIDLDVERHHSFITFPCRH